MTTDRRLIATVLLLVSVPALAKDKGDIRFDVQLTTASTAFIDKNGTLQGNEIKFLDACAENTACEEYEPTSEADLGLIKQHEEKKP